MTCQHAPIPGLEPALKRSFVCRCGRPVFFRNSRCLNCGSELGFDPVAGEVVVVDPQQDGTWRAATGDNPGRAYRRCANLDTAAACNWLLPQAPELMPKGPDGQPLVARRLCVACAVNRTIPDLSDPARAAQWGRIELAKRRLVSALLAMGLPFRSRLDEDPAHGVVFDFLADVPGQPRVLTGHADGVITLNVAEADDAVREKARAAMHEPYRTLLGHLRHEIGHYYWDLLVAGTPWLAPFRGLFGDERADYAQALQRHYDQGAPADWEQHFISAYASMHPWEDWAETWAHYLHIDDTIATANAYGLQLADTELEYRPFTAPALYDPDAPDAAHFLECINDWVRLTGVLNELSRSMGVNDFYPFVMPAAVVAKLQFVHEVVQAQKTRSPTV
ncbi:zinc-binding metallopeptidase family protein [Xanthomonas massiliensis]|uniref:zinc-binding metallopeptidase family protein n=1 Tax=Xanthomonas massiliensis TaxID=1720302 RepID=UPI000823FD7D|nr:putative zinc-binding metallopeptidase [Xanthomonas massiliensis]